MMLALVTGASPRPLEVIGWLGWLLTENWAVSFSLVSFFGFFLRQMRFRYCLFLSVSRVPANGLLWCMSAEAAIIPEPIVVEILVCLERPAMFKDVWVGSRPVKTSVVCPVDKFSSWVDRQVKLAVAISTCVERKGELKF